MRKVVLLVLCAAALVLLVSTLEANPPTRVRFVPSHPSTVQTFVAQPAVITYHYSVGYQPDLGSLVDIAAEIRELRRDLNLLVQQGVLKAPAPEHPGAVLMRNDCARCHDASVAKTKSRGVVLFEGGKFIDTDENRAAAVEQVHLGKMPKDRRWSGDQKYLFLSYHTLRPKEDKPPEKKVEKKTD